MGIRKAAYRDGLELLTEGEVLDHPEAVIEVLYNTEGGRVYFAELKGKTLCAHGDTIEEAIAEAKHKGGLPRFTEEEMAKFRNPEHRFTVGEFRALTGACRAGIEQWLKQHNLPDTVTMTLAEFKAAGGNEWAERLAEALQ